MKDKDKKRFGSNQSGYASFVITFVTLIVVSLIVVAFASDARVEQKSSLASNLATEAYYAAQSGINDAYYVIQKEVAAGDQPTSTGPNCATSGSAYLVNNSNQIAGNGSTEYNCLIVNSTPNSLQYQDVVPGQSLVVPVSNASTGNSSDNINTITISWEYYQSTVNGDNLSFIDCPSNSGDKATLPALNSTGSNSFDPTPDSLGHACDAPPLQVDYVSAASITNTGPYGTFFLEPTSNGGSAQDSTISISSQQESVYPVYCNETTPANAPGGAGEYACTQTFIPSSNYEAADSTFYLHIQTFYQPANISITATNPAGNVIDFANAQISIDSTGSAGGQLKRLDERVCYGQFCNSISPIGALQSTQCINKYFSVYPGDSNDVPGTPAGC